MRQKAAPVGGPQSARGLGARQPVVCGLRLEDQRETAADPVRPWRGFSLLELMLALSLSIVIGGALLALTLDFLTFERTFSVLVRSSAGVQTVPSLLNRYAAGAANRLDPEAGLSIDTDSFRVLSDQDGPNGFPDGALTAPFESIRVRLNQGELQLRSGRGRYQTIVSGIESLTVIRPEPALLRTSVSAVTELVPRLVHAVGVAELEFDIFLWNYRPLLFSRRNEPGGAE